ncbi:flagellar basal body rod protein FlgC [Parendozoicomonas haliclonae]|uniref:Flagellar basal-body rod protein FlgC n=1 Tax=Parendozoicomonas haliclonae TaxID=1960125 RepID=A0A1X7AIY3_9GAMM|nr:flagellar basal body rod protein FlgC [Parendozoicomonas haliclonae]SMA39792.1 Flagellar basal-body rod protein FlgC [Parendozoicomonas haliclonae]
MSLNQIFSIAGSSATAQTIRLNAVASNLANAGSAGSTPEEAYQALKPVFTVFQDNPGPAGPLSNASVQVKVSDIQRITATNEQRQYEPDHPNADEDGYVFYPKVNLVSEMADMMSASRSYQTSIEIMTTAKKMQQRLLTLGQ